MLDSSSLYAEALCALRGVWTAPGVWGGEHDLESLSSCGEACMRGRDTMAQAIKISNIRRWIAEHMEG
jgi:hypothetical protein